MVLYLDLVSKVTDQNLGFADGLPCDWRSILCLPCQIAIIPIMSISKPNTMVPMESGPQWDSKSDEGGSACVWFNVRIGMLTLIVEITSGAMVANLNNKKFLDPLLLADIKKKYQERSYLCVRLLQHLGSIPGNLIRTRAYKRMLSPWYKH